MKLARLILISAAFGLSGVCRAEPEPPLPAETAVAPEAVPGAAPVMRIKVGGPCTYATAEITATVAEVNDSGAILNQAEGRSFSFAASDFVRTGGQPEPGQAYKVSKRSITTGTCVPFVYELIGPAEVAAPEAAP